MPILRKINYILYVMKCAIENADSLIKESEVLHTNKFFCRSYTLSHIASEELGKTLICFDEILKTCNPETKTNDEFTNKFRSHKSKIRYMNLFDYFSTESNGTSAGDKNSFELWIKTRRCPTHINKLNDIKNKSLYVDITDDLQLSIPNKVFNVTLSLASLTLTKKRYDAIFSFFSFTSSILNTIETPTREFFLKIVDLTEIKEKVGKDKIEEIFESWLKLDPLDLIKAFPTVFFQNFPHLRELFTMANSKH